MSIVFAVGIQTRYKTDIQDGSWELKVVDQLSNTNTNTNSSTNNYPSRQLSSFIVSLAHKQGQSINLHGATPRQTHRGNKMYLKADDENHFDRLTRFNIWQNAIETHANFRDAFLISVSTTANLNTSAIGETVFYYTFQDSTLTTQQQLSQAAQIRSLNA